jgi:hypothetical protein
MDDKVTTWRPDTCDCVISYSWERASSEDTRVHTAFCVWEPNQADNAIVLDVRAGVCPAHQVLDVDPRTHPGNASALIRLDWHVRRATPLYSAVLAENQAKNRVKDAVRKAVGARDNDDFDFVYKFVGVGAGRELLVVSRDLPPQARAAVRAEAAKERISVTVG